MDITKLYPRLFCRRILNESILTYDRRSAKLFTGRPMYKTSTLILYKPLQKSPRLFFSDFTLHRSVSL